MTKDESQSLQIQLKQFIDQHSLESVLLTIADVCLLKSEEMELEKDLEDKATAPAWGRAYDLINKIPAKLPLYL